jgi:hypothetical protein
MKKLVKLSFEEFLKRIPYSVDESKEFVRQFNCAYSKTDREETSYLRCSEVYDIVDLLFPRFYIQMTKRWKQAIDLPSNELFNFSCEQLRKSEYIYQVDMGNGMIMICNNLSSFNKASNAVGSTICCYSLLGIILLKGESNVRC